MPQFDTTHFESQIFWTVLSFLFLFVVLKYWVLPPITQLLARRARMISDEMKRAEVLRLGAEAIKDEYERQLGKIDQQAKKMLAAAEKELSATRMAKLAELEAELQQKKQQFLEDEEVLRAQAIRDLSRQSAALVVAATEQLIGQHIHEEEAQQMLEKAINELDLHSGPGAKAGSGKHR